jgi:hypothetical protein
MLKVAPLFLRLERVKNGLASPRAVPSFVRAPRSEEVSVGKSVQDAVWWLFQLLLCNTCNFSVCVESGSIVETSTQGFHVGKE